MAAGIGRLDMAAQALGYLDQSGVLDVEGLGFRVLLLDAAEAVDADPAASAQRQALATQSLDDDWVLATVRALLDELLEQPAE